MDKSNRYLVLRIISYILPRDVVSLLTSRSRDAIPNVSEGLGLGLKIKCLGLGPQGLMRNAVPPPTMWDLVAGVGRGQLIRVKPGGVAMNTSELEDKEVIQVSVRAKRSIWWDSVRSAIAIYLSGGSECWECILGKLIAVSGSGRPTFFKNQWSLYIDCLQNDTTREHDVCKNVKDLDSKVSKRSRSHSCEASVLWNKWRSQSRTKNQTYQSRSHTRSHLHHWSYTS